MGMRIYLLEQNDNNGYDTYDSCIVCAENEEEAKNICPDGKPFKETKNGNYFNTWAKTKSSITCTEIGKANVKQRYGIILASFNAG
jgi:hypothetical protein